MAKKFLDKMKEFSSSAFPAVTLGPFHSRALETDKAKALQQYNGNYDASIRLSNKAMTEMRWQIANINSSLVSDPDITINTD